MASPTESADYRRPALAVGSDLGLMLALRPVFSRSLEVIAYDPVFRTFDGTAVTADDYVALGLVLSEGYGGVLAHRRPTPFFLRISSPVLEQVELPFFPPGRFVLEVPPQHTDCPADLARYRSLADDGYRIAVAVSDPEPPDLRVYLDFATAVKIDATRVRGRTASRFLQAGKALGLQLMCVGIGSREDFEAFAGMGCTGFSGDLFGTPDADASGRLSHNRALLFELLAELQKANASLSRIEDLVAREPALTLRILTLVNSAAVGPVQEVTSVPKAIRLLGLAQLRRWVSLLVLGDGSEAPRELLRITLVRARMCELVAKSAGCVEPESHFLTGLLSTIDAITGIALAAVVEQIPVGREVKEALLWRRNERGQILREVSRYQEGIFPCEGATLPVTSYEPLYRQSNAWARDVLDWL